MQNAETIAHFATAGVFLFGVYQYHSAQRWQRAEFAAKHLARLKDDPRLEMACIFLDWSARQLPTPEKYQRVAEGSEGSFTHSTGRMVKAMGLEEEGGWFEWPGVVYRDTFDHLFTYLEEVESYIRTNLIYRSQVQPLAYWVRELKQPRFVDSDMARPGLDSSDVFLKFMKRYGYDDALALLKRFDD